MTIRFNWKIAIRIVLFSFIVNPIWTLASRVLWEIGGWWLVLIFFQTVPPVLYGIVAGVKKERKNGQK